MEKDCGYSVGLCECGDVFVFQVSGGFKTFWSPYGSNFKTMSRFLEQSSARTFAFSKERLIEFLNDPEKILGGGFEFNDMMNVYKRQFGTILSRLTTQGGGT